MKKSVILAILGLSAAAVSSYGQGSIQFNTYNANNSAGVLASYSGNPLDNTYTGVLLYSLSPISEAAGTGALNPGWTVGSTAQFDTASTGPGFVQGPNLVLSPYTPGTVVYFELAAYLGSSYAAGSVKGHSASFSQTLATGITGAWIADGNPINGGGSGLVQSYTLAGVPEPTTMALGGLGLASLLLFRRKQA
jgi:hypothetical protein